MSVVKEVKINDFEVKGGSTKAKKMKKFAGHELFNREFFTCALVAPSMSGKTVCLKNILDKMMPPSKNKKYKIWLFVRTLHNDDTWKDIVKMLDKRGYEITFDTDLETLPTTIQRINNPQQGDYPFKKHFVILDDISDEMRCKTVNVLTKTGRHKCCIFLSCQDILDLNTGARKNAHVYLLFGRLNDTILEHVYQSARPNIEFEDFQKLYHHVHSKGKYQFLYYDKLSNEFRHNFSHILKTPEDEEQD